MPPTVRAIDVGFGQTKYTVAVHDGAIECAHFPSVALPSMVPSSSRPIVGGRRKTIEIFTNSMYYEVGQDVLQAGAQVRPPLSIDDYVETPEYHALLLGALALMKVDRIDLLVLGLPVSTFSARKAQLERLATGEHQVGGGRTVTVAKALVIAQPQGALVTFCMEQGTPDAFKHQENLVIDAGSRTFDWLCSRGYGLLSKRSGSAPFGVHNVLQQVGEAIAAEIGESYEERHAIDLALRKQKPLTIYGRPHSVDRYKPIVDSIAQDAVRALLAVVGGGYRFDHIVLVGGGAHLFKKALRAAFPKQKLHEVADPMFANVRGFQRAGMDKLGSQPIATAHAQE